ncbi:hypothetical protein EI285_07300 [Aliarcobacter skirrowii]|uniref:hypothetical protein n=1 Tax=Aliarcobacter skirrowii TaxID=28200 RepID=UPI000F67C6CE|nr:hypothetical protein [Aliarcobacter skirrowii]AZL54391.1 hypothetical protein EI285_07300 [Aliarcobacter skirrowii]
MNREEILKLEIEKLKLENENLKLSKNIKQNAKTETAEERNKRIAEAEKKIKADIEYIKSDSFVPTLNMEKTLDKKENKEATQLTVEDIVSAIDKGNSKTATKILNGYLLYGALYLSVVWGFLYFVKIG